MAVAKNQIDEVLDVIELFISSEEIRSMLTGLKQTKAYSKNKSFKDTIDRIDEARIKRLIILGQKA
jgi:hypothetical protein